MKPTVPDVTSPLRILALFIALSEATTGVAAVGTDGTTRLMLAAFAVGFPLIVFVVFVWLLLCHPGNLYPPGQYTEQTSLETYVRILRRENSARLDLFEGAVREAVASGVLEPGGPPSESSTVEDVRLRVGRAFDHAIERNTISIDIRQLVYAAEPHSVPVGDNTTVADLLNSTYFAIADAVKPYSYHDSWILRNEAGEHLDRIGTAWAKGAGRERDDRLLSAVGLHPGSTLIAQPMPVMGSTASDHGPARSPVDPPDM